MKVHYISDLHLNLWVANKTNPQKIKKSVDKLIEKLGFSHADVLILAGDLGHYFIQNSIFLEQVSQFYKMVFLVNGNHDILLVSGHSQKKYGNSYLNRKKEMKEFCSKRENLHYLDGETISFNGIKFAGVGMTWDDSFYQKLYREKPETPDIKRLYSKKVGDPKIMGDLNPKEYFEEEKRKLDGINSDIDVMITHYGPTVPDDIRENYKNDPKTTFYFFDGERYLKKLSPKKWIFGHTHDHFDFNVGKTNCLCNSFGYPNEKNKCRVKSFEI